VELQKIGWEGVEWANFARNSGKCCGHGNELSDSIICRKFVY